MDIFKKVDNDLNVIIKNYIGKEYDNNPKLASSVKFVIPPVMTGCDYSTNASMVFAKLLKKNPAIIANELANEMSKIDYIKSVKTVNGYINIIFEDFIWEQFLTDINVDGKNFGNGQHKEKVLLEFISANPTGPLHVGHCRGAILGLALSELMTKAGYDVTKEYYINDYGVQINTLLKSIQFRYEQQCGNRVNESVPEGCYPGDYLIEYAKQIADKHGAKYVGISEEEFYSKFKNSAVNAMMDIIKSDLKLLGLEYDSFISETKLVNEKKVDKVLKELSKKTVFVKNENDEVLEMPCVYQGIVDAPIGRSSNEDEQEDARCSSEPQTLFRSTAFGDDRDRVILRTDGTKTYFASDIAYHKDKYDRGYKTMINLFGADHGGYVKRITSALKAVTDGNATLDVTLTQMVALEKNGVPFKMSKRKGTFVLLSDVAREIDVDELKLFMLSKSADTQMTFDLVKVKEKSKENLVYYIQYAYARTNSLLKNFKTKFGYEYEFKNSDYNDFMSTSPKLIKELVVFMAKFPSVIQIAAEKRAPNVIVDYLKDFSSLFHSIWGTGIKLVDINDEDYSRSMMAFVSCVRNVIENSLNCIGIQPRKELVKSWENIKKNENRINSENDMMKL